MAVLLHSSTNLPAPARTISPSRFQALELWLLTAFLFMLLIVGRLTSHPSARYRHNPAPASTTLLHKRLLPYTLGKRGELIPVVQPTVFYAPSFATLQ